MAFAHVTDHETQALARLVTQYVESTGVRALVSAGAVSVQTAEDVLWALFTERLLDAAVGTQLDTLGAIVGQARESATDDQYRARLRGRILANRSDNSVEAILGVVRAVLADASAVATLTQYQPAAFEVSVDNPVTDDDAGVLAGLIADARAAGIGARLITHVDPEADTFTLADPVEFLDSGVLAGEGVITVLTSAEPFPASGTLRIGEGTVDEEDVAYTSRSGFEFDLAGTTANPHAANDAVTLVPTTEQGFGDDAVPATGGTFAGVLPA